MSGYPNLQTPWEETDEEVARRKQLAQTEQSNWSGTVIGLLVAFAALAAILST